MSLPKKILLYGLAYPAFFLASMVLGAYWTFPYDHLRDYIIEQAESGGTMQLEIESLRPSWLTGVELEGVRVVTLPSAPTQQPTELVVRRAEARVSLLALLTGTTEVTFDAELDGGGRIEGSYADGSESMRIVANVQDVDLRRIGPLRDAVGLPIAGRLSGNVDLTIAQQAADTEGSADLTLRNVSIGDGQTPLVIEGMGAGLTLERLNLGTLQVRMQTTRGVGTIQRMRANGEHAELWGSGTVRLVQPLRMSAIDLLVRIQFKDAYRQSSDRMRALFSLLEMNPQVRPARTSDGALQWRIQGAFASRIRMIPSGRSPMPGVDEGAGSADSE